MAAEVSKNCTASCSKMNNVFSYANAVSNASKPKSSDQETTIKEDSKPASIDDTNNNKENENVNKENVNIQNTLEEKPTANDVDLHDQNVEPEDDFIDYNGSKRKKKIAKTKKKEVAFKPNPIILTRNSPIKHDRIREKRREKPIVFDDRSEINDTINCDIKYVEAPVPKVNPWTIKRNAASVIKGDSFTCSEKENSPDGECVLLFL